MSREWAFVRDGWSHCGSPKFRDVTEFVEDDQYKIEGPKYVKLDEHASEVAAAVEAERERCAGIADGHWSMFPKKIADAIRKEPTDD